MEWTSTGAHHIELYSVSFLSIQNIITEKDITFNCSSLHELFWRNDWHGRWTGFFVFFSPNLSPLVLFATGMNLLHTLQKAKLLRFEGTFLFWKFTSLCSENRGLWIDSNASQFCNETTKKKLKNVWGWVERERERKEGRERGGGAVHPGGRACSTEFCTRSPASRSNPSPLYVPFLREKPFTFLDKNFASLLTAVNVLSLNMNKLQNQNVFSTFSQP